MQNQSPKQNSLLEHIQNNEELEIVKSIENSLQVARLENMDTLLGVVAKWRMYIGLPKTDVSEELMINVDFINKNYPFLTLGEIELAINLSVTRKLEDVEFYGYFSPLYVGKILDSYLYYRKKTLSDAIRRKEKADMEKKEMENRPSPEKQVEVVREIFTGFYNEWKEKGEIRDMLNYGYNFLRRIGVLIVTKEDIEAAQAYAKKKIQEKNNSSFLKPIDSENEEKRYSRNWCVQKYFESVDIDILLNNIKPEHFT